MDDSGIRALLEHLPVSWWEADEQWHLLEKGGGAFADLPTAQRFLDRMRQEMASPGHSLEDGHCLVHFDGRNFDVRWPPDESRGQGCTRGLAVEADARPAGGRRYAAFAEFADFAPAAAFIRDPDGCYLWANHSYAHLYGTTPERVVGSRIEDFDSPSDAAQFRALDQEILSRGKPVRHTLSYHRPDGIGQAAGHRFPVRENGQICVAGIYVDITEHTRAMNQRREAEENLRALRDHSGLPCALLSANGRIEQASTAAAELFRERLSDLVGRRAHTLLAAATDLPQLRLVWEGLITRRVRRVETSAVLLDARGRQRRAQLHLTTVGRSAGRATHVWAVVTHQSLAHDAHPPLTAAQVRILSLLAEGSTNGEIATSLKLSRQAVDYHLSRLRDLLGAATRPALVARAYVLGILAPHAWPPRPATAAQPLNSP
ncbi:PAS domain-containing protein [Streptomyces bathyalis]|uniref:PAS domain-containing protein n=1 Tax=Streptomyces bathyalis TaxID=2710756 RepID=A0A7T1WSL2_9ACTN|nr:PAS domain-containing protein [Streptomyces bathyalis]QPP07646.1 PAS domain-containing protein [Streptomyces bathyalis]